MGWVWHLKHNSNSMAVKWQLKSHIQTKKRLLDTCKRYTTDSLKKISPFISQALLIFLIFVVSLDQKILRGDEWLWTELNLLSLCTAWRGPYRRLSRVKLNLRRRRLGEDVYGIVWFYFSLSKFIINWQLNYFPELR